MAQEPDKKPENREERREESLRQIREACEADGVSPALTDDIVRSMRSAFQMADLMDCLFGGAR